MRFSVPLFLSLFLFAPLAQAASTPNDGRSAGAPRSVALSLLAQKAESTILHRLETKDEKEEIGARRYFTGDIDGDGKLDLLLVTSFTPVQGNTWSHDFLLIRSSAPDRPVFQNFGGKDVRSYEAVHLDHSGIAVDFLYYSDHDASCRPSVKKQGRFILTGDALIEIKE